MEKKQNKIISAGIGYTVGNYMLKGLSFLTVPLFSRLLSPAEYGVFNAYLTYQGILFLLVGMALHTSIRNAKIKYGDDFAKYNSCCILFALLGLGGWMILCNLTYPLYAQTVGFSRIVINLLLLDSYGTALIQFFNTYVGLEYRYGSFLVMAGFNALANLGLSVFLMLTIFRGDRATGRILGNALPVVLLSIVIMVYFWRKQRPALNGTYVRYAVSYSFPLIPHGLSQVVLSQFDRLMIKSMIGEAQSGIYSFAYTIFSIINVTANSMDNVWGPWFYEKMEKREYGSIRKYSSKYAFGMLLFSAMVMLLTPELVKLLGAPAYWDAVYSVIPIVAGGYFMFLYTFPSGVEYYYAKTKYIAVGTGLAAVINIALNYICIERFGYVAAAYTTLATYLLYFVFHYILAWKIHGSSIYATRNLVCCAFAAIVMACFSLLLLEWWQIRLLLFLATGVFFAVWLEREFSVGDWLKRKLGKEY